MRKIVIGASRNDKIGSKLIRWWIGANYSHVYARWYLSTQDREIVYHAAHGMVHFKPFSKFIQENDIVEEFKIELTDEQFAKFSAKCIDLSGEKYSKLQLLQIVLCDISSGRIAAQDQKGYICSELMAELLEDLGYKFIKPRYLVTPKDIIEKLKEK